MQVKRCVVVLALLAAVLAPLAAVQAYEAGDFRASLTFMGNGLAIGGVQVESFLARWLAVGVGAGTAILVNSVHAHIRLYPVDAAIKPYVAASAIAYRQFALFRGVPIDGLNGSIRIGAEHVRPRGLFIGADTGILLSKDPVTLAWGRGSDDEDGSTRFELAVGPFPIWFGVHLGYRFRR